jgi:hypothetical protein
MARFKNDFRRAVVPPAGLAAFRGVYQLSYRAPRERVK